VTSSDTPFASRPVAGLGLSPSTTAELSRRFRLLTLPAESDPATEVLAVQKGKIDAALLDRLPALKLVATSAAGFDNLDFDLLKSRGITLSNRGNSRDIDVADLAIGLLIDAVRRIAFNDRVVRAGRWVEGRVQQKQRVSGRKLGVLGLGRIGEDICKRAAGFDTEIGYHNRRRRSDVPYRYFATPLELAEWCDFLVIAVPLDGATLHQVDRRILDAVGPDGTVVNIARGAVIDETALIEALETGSLGSAGLDVFENEPNVPERLARLDNVVMTPHIGGFTDATQADALAALVANIENYFRTGRPIAVVNI
jgi:lactate dehydrogenase-like 2-hydroxyacid dehydrogenase